MKPTDENQAADKPCVLVVDDHDLVRGLLVELLEKADYSTISADTGEAAIDLLKAHGANIECIIQDMSMPSMSGEEIIRRTLDVDPNAQILVLSVDDSESVARQLGGLPVAGYLEKPCDSRELLKKVAAIVG